MKSKWGKKMLGEICSFSNGLWTGKKPPFIEVQVIRNTNFTKDGWLDLSDVVTLQVEKSQFEKRRLQIGDIILEKSGGGPKQPVGRVVLFEQETGDYSFSNFTSIIRINDQQLVDYQFLHKFLYKEYISGATEKMQSHSTGIRNLKFDEYKEIEVPIPPLPEQQRIVSILDEAFEAIDQAKANTERNLQNARELFQSELNRIFTNKGEGWVEKTLQDIVDPKCTLSYGIVQPGEEFPDGMPVIRPTDLTSKFISAKGLKRIDPRLADSYKRTTLVGDELLLCVRGNTGVISIATKELEGANVTRGIVPIRFKLDLLSPEFGYYQFISDFILKQIKGKTYGAALMQINIGDLRKLSMLVPSFSDQQRIINQLDTLSAETKQLEANYHKKLEGLEELKKSILQKAFSGELTRKTTEIQMEQLDMVAEDQAKYQPKL